MSFFFFFLRSVILKTLFNFTPIEIRQKKIKGEAKVGTADQRIWKSRFKHKDPRNTSFYP